MVHKYSCKNFYSIDDKVKINFVVNQHAPDTNVYVEGKHGRLSLLENVVGPNSSGKTNIIKALSFMRQVMIDNPSDTPVKTAAFGGNIQKPSEFSVEFSLEGRLFIHELKLDAHQILSELIKEKKPAKQRTTTTTLFSRKWNKTKSAYMLKGNSFKLPGGMYPSKGASIVASFALTGDKNHIATKMFGYWRDSVITNIFYRGCGVVDDIPQDETVKIIIDRLIEQKDEWTNNIITTLRQLDVGFNSFKRQRLELINESSYAIEHNLAGGKKVQIPIEDESSGVKRTIVLLFYIYQTLNSGGIAALDELDAYLHPDIAENLVKRFMSPDTNPHQAQILFTSHSHKLLNEFNKQQITLVEKNADGATEVYRLDEVKGLRADDNYYLKYVTGTYGAKPRIGW